MGRTQAGENGNDTKVTMHRDDEVESLEKAVRVRKRDLTFRNHEFERPGGADSEEEFSNRGKGAAAHFRCVDGRSLCLKPFRAEFIDEFLQVCIATQIWRVRSNLEDRHGRLRQRKSPRSENFSMSRSADSTFRKAAWVGRLM